MANKNDALKKHHFWILAALAPVLVLLAVVFLMTGVSGAIDTANKEVADADNTVKGANAPGQGTLAELDKKKEKLGEVRGQLWKLNWDKQAPFFYWPETPTKTFDKYNTMKFGTSFRDFISNPNLIELLKPAYRTTYEKLGESIAPTTFKGGWETVLRWVANWGNQAPESKQLWLAMEDVWIQRALLQPIAQVNEDIARFTVLKPNGQNPPPKKRTFRSHVWDLDLEVAARKPSQGTGQVLKARLKNRTNQLQVLGVGSAMQLKVWFDPKMDLPPFDFRIEGAGVEGGETLPKADPNKRAAGEEDMVEILLPPGTDVVELAKVAQVLDKRTVPIRRLDRLALGYPSAKDSLKVLNAPPFFPDAAPIDPTAGGTGMPPGGTGMPPGVMSSAGSSSEGGSGYPPGGTGGTAAAGPGRAGGLRLLDVADLNKKRYVEINDQLRRVPVAMTLIVDQMYVNEVLIAYANSPLRFETVQYHWQRFTESLNQPATGTYPGDPANPGSGDTGESGVASGFAGSGLSSGGYGLPPGGGVPPGGMGSGSNQYGGIPGLGAETLSSISEAQANSGLIQLTVYGIVTLYERYDPVKKEGDAAAAAPATPPADAPTPMTTTPPAATPMTPAPAPAAPMNTTPTPAAPTTPAPAAPVTPAPTTPAPAAPAPTTPPAAPTPTTPPAAPPK